MINTRKNTRHKTKKFFLSYIKQKKSSNNTHKRQYIVTKNAIT